jgi:RNA polymerase sigma-70 factor (ECF subfamily)
MRLRATSAPLVLLAIDPPKGDPTSDADLVRRAIDGDAWAEAAIYRRYAGLVARLAARMLGQRSEALDVLQDVFIEALSELHTLRDPSALRPWLLRRTVNAVSGRFRRRRLRRFLGLSGGDEPCLELASTDCSPEVSAELAGLSAVIASLPARQRIAWVLHHVEGETLPAVAEACGVSLATVKRDVLAAQTALDAHVGRAPRGER